MKGKDLSFFSLGIKKKTYVIIRAIKETKAQDVAAEQERKRNGAGGGTENKEHSEEAVKLVVSAAAITQMTATDPGSGTQSLSRSQGRHSASRSCHSGPYAPSQRSTVMPHLS